MHHAAASRADQRIAGGDVGCGAPAAERAWGPHVISSARTAAIAIRRTVRIGDDGVIEQIKELHPELGVVPLLEREVLEYGEIHVLEARVAEEVPAHRAKGSSHRRNHRRLAVYVAAPRLYPFCLVACQGVDVGGDTTRTGERRGEGG